MKILLRIPTWLGDGVMLTPAFEILKKEFKNASFTIVGSGATCGLLSRDKRVKNIYIDESKKSKFRFLAI